ncbi:MAG: YigZ family protein [Bacilli bacterium]|nr:YigZ family protein [Bacilli bacterium]
MLSIKLNDKYEEIVKSSKFISLIFRVYSREEVNYYLDKVKEEYPNATHYCYGYVIDNDIRSSDDGEPSKTAGIPILNQITSNNLNYVLIIVVRYFGGIKLGAGPLTRTYAKVARDVIKSDNIIKLIHGYDIDIIFNYDNIKSIDYILGNSKIVSKEFNDYVRYNVLVNEEILNNLSNYNVVINTEIYIEKE